MSAPTRERVLQRVVLPSASSFDVLALYVETDFERRITTPETGRRAADAVLPAAVEQTQTAITFDPEVSRRSATIAANKRVSFATYFNAFPASYWRRWTVVDTVTLRVRISGEATVIVYRSNPRGRANPVDTAHVDGGEQTFEFELPLTQFIDGGWYWFDISAGADGAQLRDAEWVANVPDAPSGRASIGITTFNRADFVVDLLRSLGEARDALEVVDSVYLVDQGTQRARDHSDFADSTKGLADRLVVIEQGNLGGSGGFARSMAETLEAGTSDYVLLLDDDVVIEPEGILRAVTFADLARRPTIVGGHMFSLHERSVLNAFGEVVRPYKWWWGAASQTKAQHDFGASGLRHTPWLHRRVDADYNGWWMCLIPTRIVAELGLSLPVFIKWDDAEYGLRAQRAGYPTVSLPGAAVWHVPWHDKNDAVDWQAYYHIRNRLISALLHSPYERGGRVVAESMEIQLQHLLSMQYSTATLRLRALRDLLDGPRVLHQQLPGKNAELRDLRAGFPDAQAKAEFDDFPPVRRRKPPGGGLKLSSPKNPVSLVLKAGMGVLRQLRPIDEETERRPFMAIANQDAIWWLLSNVDSALVSSADGTSISWYQRKPKQFRALMRESIALHAKLLAEWPKLSSSYRDALSEITSVEEWRKTFASG